MKDNKFFDVIIVGGSYSGLAAAMALGRALMRVVIIDNGKPCNRQTPHSHNFLTQDGRTPQEIRNLAKQQVEKYDTVEFFEGTATSGVKVNSRFEIQTSTGEKFSARKLIFATGIRDIMQQIDGYKECWGISVIHCPYCHGYEVRGETTGILGNGDYAFEFCSLISNWTKDLMIFTNGISTLTKEQTVRIQSHHIKIIETEIDKLEHTKGQLQQIVFKDRTTTSLKALYARSPFEQHCSIPEIVGCELTEEGYIKADTFQKTTVEGVFACGDNTTRMRTVANAVAMGTTAGIAASKEIVLEEFEKKVSSDKGLSEYKIY